MDWEARITNYVRVTGFPRCLFLSEDGRVVGTWIMGNDYRVKSGYYGGYPAGYLRRVKALFPDKKKVLHIFSGRVDLAALPGDTVDVNPELDPTYVDDAQLSGRRSARRLRPGAGRPALQHRGRRTLPDNHGETKPRHARPARRPARHPHRLARPGAADVPQGHLRRGSGDRHGEEHQPPLSRRDRLQAPRGDGRGAAGRKSAPEAASSSRHRHVGLENRKSAI